MINYANEKLISGANGNEGRFEGLADVSFLIGATIIDTGYVCGHREGGFSIDYIDNVKKKMRVVFGYNEFGLWIQWRGEAEQDDEYQLYNKLSKKWDDICCKKVNLKENPFELSFSFVDDEDIDNVLLTLSIKEIKLMGNDVIAHFSGTEKNIEEILESIYDWMTNYLMKFS